MTKKRSSEILGMKMEILSEKNVFQKFWSAKKFSVPPNSAPGLRRWALCMGFIRVEVFSNRFQAQEASSVIWPHRRQSWGLVVSRSPYFDKRGSWSLHEILSCPIMYRNISISISTILCV